MAWHMHMHTYIHTFHHSIYTHIHLLREQAIGKTKTKKYGGDVGEGVRNGGDDKH